MRVDGVLFDIDDTLVDTRGAFVHALSGVARRWLPDLPAERHDELVTVWRADVGGHYAAYTRGDVGYTEQRMARANELHERFGGPALDDDGFARWDRTFEAEFSGAWFAHPDVDAVVDRLLDAGLAVGALSNASVAYQTRKLEHAALLDRVPMLVGVDTLGFGKPHPQTFLEACRRLGTEPERTAYVGDELDVDAVGAVGAGLIGVWLDRPDGRRRAISAIEIGSAHDAGVLRIDSLSKVPEALGIDLAT
ncbi:HAD family hydrolase [Cellulomonas sp. ICMP 17802]|uniref:HAD family hydrolase n=1 Tax=Cellulomonas sp. ICMP 17802 TaxID=3239199 RepID=UPI00351B3310